jgi:hypothetical protein
MSLIATCGLPPLISELENQMRDKILKIFSAKLFSATLGAFGEFRRKSFAFESSR